jgi:hypothetical protein
MHSKRKKKFFLNHQTVDLPSQEQPKEKPKKYVLWQRSTLIPMEKKKIK